MDFCGEESCLYVTKADFSLQHAWVLLGCGHTLRIHIYRSLIFFSVIIFPIFLNSIVLWLDLIQFLKRFANYFFYLFSSKYLFLKTCIFWQHLAKANHYSNPILNTNNTVETFSSCSSSSCPSPPSPFLRRG